MPLTPQPRPSGKRTACVLSRKPVPPPPPPQRTPSKSHSQPHATPPAEIHIVGSRVHRLLHDARATVRAQERPDTPLLAPPPAPKRGSRLTAMSAAPSRLASSAAPIHPSAFGAALDAARDDPPAQLERLAELQRWLSHPQRALWADVLAQLTELSGAPGTDARVAVRAAAVLLRHVDGGAALAGLPRVVRRLHELCRASDGSAAALLWREAAVQPLLRLLSSEAMLTAQPAVLWDALETLRLGSAKGGDTATPLVSIGAIPAANALAKRILAMAAANADGVGPLVAALVPPLCLLYRNLSTTNAAQLRKLGALDHLVDLLDRFREDGEAAQAAARAIAKTAFDDECLAHYQSSQRTARAVVLALEANMETGGLVISRLCGILARLVESHRELRDWLMHHHHRTLVRLVRTHATKSQPKPPPIQQQQQEEDEDEEVPSPPPCPPLDGQQVTKGGQSMGLDAEDSQLEDLLQSITWLIGVAAISAECLPTFVREITPPLVEFVRDLDASKWHLTFIYTLMCLSNLSFFFAALEREEGGREVLESIYATLGLVLAGILFDGDTEATVEATRVLGNMSLTNAGRDWMESNRCDEVCVVFLGHEDARVVYNCFGVLLNLTAADTCRVSTEAELLHMLLQHTGRYTREEDIAAERRKERIRSAERRGETDDTVDVSYTDQIADLVEKLLLNLSGLVGVDAM